MAEKQEFIVDLPQDLPTQGDQLIDTLVDIFCDLESENEERNEKIDNLNQALDDLVTALRKMHGHKVKITLEQIE